MKPEKIAWIIVGGLVITMLWITIILILVFL
jgi:hypothetical protein